MSAAKSIKECTGVILKVGVFFSTLAVLISDILKPLANFTLYFLVGLSITLFIMAAVYFFNKANVGFIHNFYEKLEKLSNGYWFAAAFVIVVLTLIAFFIMFLLNNGTTNGVLSERSHVVKVFQEDIGLLKSHIIKIKEDTGQMVQEQKKTNELLTEIVKPTDPKEQLAKMGISFTIPAFRLAVSEGSTEKVALFLAGGMSPYCIDRDQGATRPVLMNAVIEQTPNYPKIIAEAVKLANFNPNHTFDVNIDDQDTLKYYLSLSFQKFFMGTSPMARFDPQIDFGDQPFSLGLLLPVLIIEPNDTMISFIREFNIDIARGLAVREHIYATYKTILEDDFSFIRSQFPDRIMQNMTASIRVDYPQYRRRLEASLLKYKAGTEKFKAATAMAAVPAAPAQAAPATAQPAWKKAAKPSLWQNKAN